MSDRYSDVEIRDDEINHSACPPGSHDTSADGAPEEQTRTANGQLACNHCGPDRGIFYCRRTEWYGHVDNPEQGCFLIADHL